MAIFGVKDWPLWRAGSRAWIWPWKHFTGGTEQAFYFWQKKNKFLNINYSIWKYRHCIKRITFQFCRPEDQMQTKYGSFQQIGPHADQICNCGPLCKYCICIAPYPKECFLWYSSIKRCVDLQIVTVVTLQLHLVNLKESCCSSWLPPAPMLTHLQLINQLVSGVRLPHIVLVCRK